MSKFNSPLDNIKIASPCSTNWNEMFGNERMRFWGDCKLNVFNLWGMSRKDAENLIRSAEGRLCIRFYRRKDGTIITQNCPVGWAKVKQRAKGHLTAGFSLLLALFSGLFFVSIFAKANAEVGTLVIRPTPTPLPPPDSELIMGAVSYREVPKPDTHIRPENYKRPASSLQ